MKLFDKITKKIMGQAGDAAKTEVKKTALDLLPKLLGIAAMAAGIVIFKSSVIDGRGSGMESVKMIPGVSNTTITTNNYFFNEVSEDMMRRIIEK